MRTLQMVGPMTLLSAIGGQDSTASTSIFKNITIKVKKNHLADFVNRKSRLNIFTDFKFYGGRIMYLAPICEIV
jgi:hypothetical protein